MIYNKSSPEMKNNNEAIVRFIIECFEKCTQDKSLGVWAYARVWAIVEEQYLILGLKYFFVKLDRKI